MLGAADPVAAGFVATLGRPGANITGVASTVALLAGKQIELLRDVAPRMRRVAFLRPPRTSANERLLAELQGAARRLGLELKAFDVANRADVDRAVALSAAYRPVTAAFRSSRTRP